MPFAFLPDRAVVQVAGEDAASFLQGLVTCDVETLAPGEGRLGALLSPQGKILFDFLVSRAPEAGGSLPGFGGGYVLDCPRALAADLVKRLSFYKLRAKVTARHIHGPDEPLGVAAAWGADRVARADAWRVTDSRVADLGKRLYVWRHDADAIAGEVAPRDYHAYRIALGVPEGGKDFIYGDTFPHEADMDQLGGVDFAKGCYVGQEVVSRMEHRGTARSRIVPVVFADGIVPVDGLDVTAGERSLGKLGSCAAGRGLALLRLDRVADALAAGATLMAGGLPLRLEKPAWARFAFPGDTATIGEPS